ncbi:hypothetical protein QFC22_001636 [Naganishia vaughanmartiniae]|uniref:Uncharacterized protein n=1 Tax=Naganishia vaughanmartiniae TaxID=1424756 RepID=A0ACC2XJ75_9TREE|nr:hypothetical protein QFC22_001636 [Naganishia vaughanmartiniae]
MLPSIVVPRKKGDSSRHKQQKLKGKATEANHGDYNEPDGSYVQYLPLSPDPTTLSGQSTGHDAFTRYESRSPDQPSYFRSPLVPEVVVLSALPAPKTESSYTSTKTSSVGHKSNAIKTYQRKSIVAKVEKDASQKTLKKTSGQSQRSTPGKQQSRTGVMAAPKAVHRDDMQPTSARDHRTKKRLRMEEKNGSTGQSSKFVKSNNEGRHTKKSEHNAAKKLKLIHSACNIIATSSSTSHTHSSATADVRTVISKHPKTLIAYTNGSQSSKATMHAARANEKAEAAPSRFRVKEKIDYRVKLALTLNPPEPKPPGTKSKGKAVRKKINQAFGDAPAMKRAPSPFPAWHRTTSALSKAGVAEVEMKDVEEIPEDDCYVYIPSKWVMASASRM